jgi:kynureninase
MEAGAFPSDQYAIETHLRWHGLEPSEHIIEVAPKQGSRTIDNQDILDAIANAGETLSLVMIGGLQYATGQVFDMQQITIAGHAVGAKVGFDLAHAIGNIRLALTTWDVDFACWCTYKYLNSGPGGIAGIYINPKHGNNKALNRLAGWWGHDEEVRFLMKKGFDPMAGAQGWQHSNGPVLLLATLRASLAMVKAAGWENLLTKQAAMQAFMLRCLQQPGLEKVQVLTPQPAGCQFSLVVQGGKKVFHALRANGILGDWREPDIIRLSPVPMYNSFEDIYLATTVLAKVLAEVNAQS